MISRLIAFIAFMAWVSLWAGEQANAWLEFLVSIVLFTWGGLRLGDYIELWCRKRGGVERRRKG